MKTQRLMGVTVTTKPLKKGCNLLDSGFVENIQDNSLPNGNYAPRAHVHHSMKKLLPLNLAMVISGARSGSIKRCCCSCEASACNLCAHITAVLLHLDDYIKANGYVATVPSTSISFVWNKGKRREKTQVQFIKPIIHRTNEKTQMFMISTPA